MRYRVFMSVEIEAPDDRAAYKEARKLEELLKSPMVQMAVTSTGVQLGQGGVTVHAPRREG